MNKILKFKKEEKRLVALLYKKGFLKNFKLSDLYWAEYSHCRTQKRKHGRKHRNTIYFPEMHFCTTDYWGESDEHSIVDAVYPSYDYIYQDDICKVKTYSRIQMIKSLKKMRTIVNNNKIRIVLKVKLND